MSSPTYYVPVAAPGRGFGPARLAAWIVLAGSVAFMAVGGLAGYRWLDTHLFNWGVATSARVEVNQAELLERVRAFEVITVKHTYASRGQLDIQKAFNAGPASLGLPGWVAGQKLDVRGDVTVMAGVNLAAVGEQDIDIRTSGDVTNVVIRLPAAEVLAVQIEPGSLDMATSAGVLTRIRRTVGLSEEDIRDRSADQLTAVARETAVRNGILLEAGSEAEVRLRAFLESVSGGGNVVYTVLTREPAEQAQ